MMKRFIFLLVTMATCLCCRAELSVECIKMKNSDDYKLSFRDTTFGDDDTAWIPSFYISEYGTIVDFLVLSNKAIPPAPKGNINDLKINFTSGGSLIFLCTSNTIMHYSTDMHMAVLKPVTFDAMNSPINYCEAVYMDALSSQKIKSVTLNGLLLPGPYPSPDDFRKLFNEGVSKFPGSEYFKYYRDMNKGSKVSKPKGSGGNSGAAATKPSQPKTVARPKDIPSPIEITPATGNDKGLFTMQYKGGRENKATIDLGALPGNLPPCLNIPLDRSLSPSLEYLVSFGSSFSGCYMEKLVTNYGTFYSSKVEPQFEIETSRIFDVDNVKYVLTTEVSHMGAPVIVSFSQEENATVKCITIQLELRLKQLTVSKGVATEKKACKEVDKYFTNAMAQLKKAGFKVEKKDKNVFKVYKDGWSYTFENHMNNNYTYGNIRLLISRCL